MKNYNKIHSAIGKIKIHHDGFAFFNATSKKIPPIFISKGKTEGLLENDVVEMTWEEKEKYRPVLSIRVLSRSPRDFAMITVKDGGVISLSSFSKIKVNLKIKELEKNKVLKNSSPGEVWRVSFNGEELGDTITVERPRKVGTLKTVSGYHTAMLIEGGQDPDIPTDSEHLIKDRDYEKRTDWTDITFITVDGASTKDFDDAINVKATKSGWKIRVAIADVSSYIEENSFVDNEAKSRGATVYLPSDIRPMFSFKISNSLCSLLEGEERAVLGVTLEYDSFGKLITKPKFEQAKIIVKKRCLFQEVEQLVSNKKNKPQISKNISNVLYDWHAWFLTQENEGVDFTWNEDEYNICVDDNLKVTCESLPQTYTAYKMVETLMVEANYAAANFLVEKYRTGIFRNQLEPIWEKGANFLNKSGWRWSMPPDNDGAKKWWRQSFLKYVDSEDYCILCNAWLKMQTKASYDVKSEGHSSLGKLTYTHFTSPIRRYADVIVHRMIKSALYSKPYDDSKLEEVVKECEATTQRVRVIERDVRNHWVARWWEQQPSKTRTDGVVAVIKTDGTIIVNTKKFNTRGVLLLDKGDNDVWFVGKKISLEYAKVKKDKIYFYCC